MAKPVVVVMGVSGCGKSTIGIALANKLNVEFRDGDDLHPQTNVDKMRAGQPLTDDDRIPWLQSINALLKTWRHQNASGVIACSALKASYRAILAQGVTSRIVFVYLKASIEFIARRLDARRGHFMPPSLLASQFAALEAPDADEGFRVIQVDLERNHTPAETVAELVAHAYFTTTRLPEPALSPIPVEAAQECLCHSCNRPFTNRANTDPTQASWYCPTCLSSLALGDEPLYIICSICDCDWQWQPSEEFPELGQVPTAWRCPVCRDPAGNTPLEQSLAEEGQWDSRLSLSMSSPEDESSMIAPAPSTDNLKPVTPPPFNLPRPGAALPEHKPLKQQSELKVGPEGVVVNCRYCRSEGRIVRAQAFQQLNTAWVCRACRRERAQRRYNKEPETPLRFKPQPVQKLAQPKPQLKSLTELEDDPTSFSPYQSRKEVHKLADRLAQTTFMAPTPPPVRSPKRVDASTREPDSPQYGFDV